MKNKWCLPVSKKLNVISYDQNNPQNPESSLIQLSRFYDNRSSDPNFSTHYQETRFDYRKSIRSQSSNLVPVLLPGIEIESMLPFDSKNIQHPNNTIIVRIPDNDRPLLPNKKKLVETQEEK